jgi:Cys-tRNA(Pro)/Cys-tRNA(Cys) deacylase
VVQLTAAGVRFRIHDFSERAAGHSGAAGYGQQAASALGVPADQVFKTLLVMADGEPAVAVVPVSGTLSMKRIAGTLHAKRAEMCRPAAAERITGYVVGGISPFGQRRRLPTVVDETCVLWDTIFVSGGRRGLDIEIAPDDLVALLDAVVAGIADL